MKADFQGITSRIEHYGERGTAREKTLEDALRQCIPDKYAFSKGIIINSNDEQSKQVDIIIHDKMLTPYLLNKESTKIIPIESVYGVIEVKSRLTKSELGIAIKNIESVRKLPKSTMVGMSCPTAGYIFAFDSDSSLENVYKNFVELSKDISIDQQVSCICVLNKGLIIPIDKNNLLTIKLFPALDTTFAIFDDAENALLLFYLILFQTLNSVVVFPPNMLEYAHSSGTLRTSFVIPSGYLPENATFSSHGYSITIKELNEMQALGNKILSGEIQKEEFLDCEFGYIISSLIKMHGSLDKVPQNSVLNFFDSQLSCQVVLQMYEIYRRRGNASQAEMEKLREFEAYLYKIYDSHREEMKSKAIRQQGRDANG